MRIKFAVLALALSATLPGLAAAHGGGHPTGGHAGTGSVDLGPIELLQQRYNTGWSWSDGHRGRVGPIPGHEYEVEVAVEYFTPGLAPPPVARATTLGHAPQGRGCANGAPAGYKCPFRARIAEFATQIASAQANGRISHAEATELRWHQRAIGRTARHIARDGHVETIERDFMLSRLDDQSARIATALSGTSRHTGVYGGAYAPAEHITSQSTVYYGH